MVPTGVRAVSTGNGTPLQDTARIETGQINRKSDAISVVVRLIPESESSVRPTDFISLTRSLTTPLTLLLRDVIQGLGYRLVPESRIPIKLCSLITRHSEITTHHQANDLAQDMD